MRIKYKTYFSYSGDKPVEESVEYWLEYNLSSGGIEEKIDKLKKLLTIIGEEFLMRNPDRLIEVVDAVDCPGGDHTIVD